MRKFSTFAAASVIAAGLASVGATSASAADTANPCRTIVNAVGAVKVDDGRGGTWICRGKTDNVPNRTGHKATACWAKTGHTVTLVNGAKKTTCKNPGKSLDNVTYAYFKVS